MTFSGFEREAQSAWARIPAHFRRGVDGLVVNRETASHPELDDVFTMGECITESWPSDFGGPETTRSLVVLYYGSFTEVARDAADFDWAGEIWETLTHELQHHLESLAGDDALEDMDYAADQNFKRREGGPFDPFFFRAGEPMGDGMYRVDNEYFIERPLTGEAHVVLPWDGQDVRVALPVLDPSDVIYIEIIDRETDEPTALSLVLARELRGLRAFKALLRPRAPVVTHAEAFIG